MTTKKILSYAVWGGLFLVPFIAFIVPGNMFFPFISGKGFAFRILVEILFGLYALLAFMAPEYRPKCSWITRAVGVFALAILVADLLGANVFKSLWSNYERMEGFVLIAHLVLYYIVASSFFRTAKDWYQWFNVSLIASVMMSLYGVLQLAGKITINQGGARLDGTFGNSSYFAIYLVFHIFLALYMLAQTYNVSWKKWIYGAVVILEVWMLYFTATRGAILGLIGGLILSSVIIAWKEKENKILRKSAIGLLVGIVVFIGLFISMRNVDFVKKSPVMSRFASLDAKEIQTQGRYFVWPMAIKGVAERPLFGWGQENFNFVFNKNYDPRMYGQEQWFDRTHNVLLDWLIAGGIVGFLAYASMFVAMFYYIWKKGTGMLVTEKSLLTGMISAYVFHNMFVFDNLISYILFFSVLAYVHTRGTANKEMSGKFYTKTFSSDTLNYMIAPAIVIVVAVSIYFVNVPAISANTTLIKSMVAQQNGGVEENLALFKQTFDYNSFGNSEALEQLIQVTSQISSSQVPETLKKQFYDLAKLKIEEKIKATPNDARYVAFAEGFFNRFGQYDEAIKYGTRAIELSPKKQAMYFELGTSYIGKKDFAKAFEIFKQAYDFEPESPESKIIYAVGAIYSKNDVALKDILQKIDVKSFVTDDRILRAYLETGDIKTIISILTERVKINPSNQNKLSLASAYIQAGQKQKAVDIINDMIKADPNFKTEGEGYIKQIWNQ